MTTTRNRPAPAALRIVLLTMIACFALTACKQRTSDRDITTVGYSELAKMLAKDGPSTVVIDVRNWQTYDQGHIATAICIPLPELRGGDPLLRGAERLVVYAGGFDSPLTAAAAKRLVSEGYTNVYAYRGGYQDWVDQGGPVQRLDSQE